MSVGVMRRPPFLQPLPSAATRKLKYLDGKRGFLVSYVCDGWMNYGTCDLPNEKLLVMCRYTIEGAKWYSKAFVQFRPSYSVSTHNQPFFIW
jgi:hypothetical protein